MKTTHPDGIELYEGRVGRTKGKFKVRLWVKGRIKATGEGYVNKAEAKAWARQVFSALNVWLAKNP